MPDLQLIGHILGLPEAQETVTGMIKFDMVQRLANGTTKSPELRKEEWIQW